jgi:hypothetical protein
MSHAGKFFTSIAVQLARNVPSLRQHLCDDVADQSNIAGLSPRPVASVCSQSVIEAREPLTSVLYSCR